MVTGGLQTRGSSTVERPTRCKASTACAGQLRMRCTRRCRQQLPPESASSPISVSYAPAGCNRTSAGSTRSLAELAACELCGWRGSSLVAALLLRRPTTRRSDGRRVGLAAAPTRHWISPRGADQASSKAHQMRAPYKADRLRSQSVERPREIIGAPCRRLGVSVP